jgi:hypothetical protein
VFYNFFSSLLLVLCYVFCFCFVFVLFLFCFCFVFVLFLFCFCFVFVLFLFCFCSIFDLALINSFFLYSPLLFLSHTPSGLLTSFLPEPTVNRIFQLIETGFLLLGFIFFITPTFITAFGVVYVSLAIPVYYSISNVSEWNSATKTPHKKESLIQTSVLIRHRLEYWVIAIPFTFLFLVLEAVGIESLPGWWHIKLGFFIWLQFPFVNGTETIMNHCHRISNMFIRVANIWRPTATNPPTSNQSTSTQSVVGQTTTNQTTVNALQLKTNSAKMNISENYERGAGIDDSPLSRNRGGVDDNTVLRRKVVENEKKGIDKEIDKDKDNEKEKEIESKKNL